MLTHWSYVFLALTHWFNESHAAILAERQGFMSHTCSKTGPWYIWVRSRNCGCLVTWFCYQLIAKPGNKTATVPWPDPYYDANTLWYSITGTSSLVLFIFNCWCIFKTAKWSNSLRLLISIWFVDTKCKLLIIVLYLLKLSCMLITYMYMYFDNIYQESIVILFQYGLDGYILHLISHPYGQDNKIIISVCRENLGDN